MIPGQPTSDGVISNFTHSQDIFHPEFQLKKYCKLQLHTDKPLLDNTPAISKLSKVSSESSICGLFYAQVWQSVRDSHNEKILRTVGCTIKPELFRLHCVMDDKSRQKIPNAA